MRCARVYFINLLFLLLLSVNLVGCGNGVFSQPAPTANVMPSPSFSPDAGTYSGSQFITITESVPGAAIYYTVDGTNPSASSNIYTAPIPIKANTTIKAFATAANYTSSSVVSISYAIAADQAVTPTFTPAAGAYNGAQLVTIASVTPGAAIYYTVDGSVPTLSSSLYKDPINVAASGTIAALAIAAGVGNSAIATAKYTIAATQAVSPVFSPGPGTYSSAQTVTLSTTTAGANIYYTTDGTAPTTTSTQYTIPITVGATEIVSAVAGGPDFTSSTVASASYTISVPALSAPVFRPLGGSYTTAQQIVMSDALESASIFYTTDGSQPTTSGEMYTAPINVSASQTITAIATATGFKASAASRATYSIGANSSSSSAPYTFKSTQIVGGGFVDGIVMHPGQQGLMYARTDVGGAYRWDSTTKQWLALTDFLTRDQGNYLGIESIAIDPADPNKVYLACGTYADSFGTNGAILISDNQGGTFTTVQLPFKVGSNDAGRFAGERLSVDPNLGSHLYFGSRLNGLWQSTDSGGTWTQVTSFPVTGAASGNPASTGGVIFEDFVKGSGASAVITPTVYVGVADSTVSALYVSADSGTTWAAVAGQPNGLFLNRGVLGNDGNLYLSYSNALGPADATSGAIWRYTLPTTAKPIGTWKNITPLPSFAYDAAKIGYGSVTADPQRPGVIMATTLDLYYLHDDVFRSLDGGNSWIDLGGNESRDSSLSPWLNFGETSPGIGNWLVGITIDPYDSNHVLYGTGQTIWQTSNATAADGTTTSAGTTSPGVVPTSWSVGAVGIEESVALSLISPPAGANVLSGVRDIGGFTHTDLTTSPSGGMHLNPLFIDTTSLDFAQSQPAAVVRVGNSLSGQNGAFSTDGGKTWTAFKNLPGAGSSNGTVAISADGKNIVWSPSNSTAFLSTDFGETWSASSGAPTNITVLSDRVNSTKFYMYDSSAGILYGSVDGAFSFHTLATGLPKGSLLKVSYAAEGDLWLASTTGLSHSINSGATFSPVLSTSEAYDVSFGKPLADASYPAIYMYGRLAGIQGIFRSTDSGINWTSVTDPIHQYGSINTIAADPKVFGRVYLGTSGRGIIYGDSAP